MNGSTIPLKDASSSTKKPTGPIQRTSLLATPAQPLILPPNQRQQRIGQYVWKDPATGQITEAPPNPPPQLTPAEVYAVRSEVAARNSGGAEFGICFWSLMVFLILFVFLIILFASYGPYYYGPPDNDWSHHHRDGDGHESHDGASFSDDGVPKQTAKDCLLDEEYNDEVKMCVMKVHFPSAVAPEIVDTRTKPCDDIFKHACGAFMDIHKGSRGFEGLAMINRQRVKSIITDPSVKEVHAFYRSCRSTLVDSSERKKRRESHLLETKLTRDGLLGRMLEPLVSTEDLPIVFARMTAAGFTIPVSLTMQKNPTDAGIIPMFTYDGFSGLDQERDWVRMHFEVMYGADGPKADEEAVALIDMVNKLNLERPDKGDIYSSYESWVQYALNEFKNDVVAWSEFKDLSNSPFDWEAYLRELNARLAISNVKFEPGQKVWAFSKRYFQWWHPEEFTVQDWKRFVTFSVLYHTHDFFPDLPNDVLFRRFEAHPASGTRFSPGHPSNRHRRMKKARLSPVEYFDKTPLQVMEMAKSNRYTVVADKKTPNTPWSRRLKRRRRIPGWISRMSSSLARTNNAENKKRTVASRIPLKNEASPSVPGPSDADEGIVVSDSDCIAAAKYMLPGIISEEYLKRHFKNGDRIRTRVKAMTEKIRDTAVRNVLATPWMHEKTKQAIAEKLRAIVPRVVQPNEWTKESFPLGKEMDPDRYLRNLLIIQEERVRRDLSIWSPSRFGKACDAKCRDETTRFGSPVFTVNAWYNPDSNVISVPAGILQPPFFHESYNDASMHATIGWVLGHEMGHGTDSNGVLFDKNGAINSTLTEEDAQNFREREMCIVREYGTAPDGCDPMDYGQHTNAENMADHTGFKNSWRALFDGNATATKQDKIEFIMAASQMWCTSRTQQEICALGEQDVHADPRDRVKKTLAHAPMVAEALDCPVGSAMHRQPHERCVFFGEDAIEYPHSSPAASAKATKKRNRKAAGKK